MERVVSQVVRGQIIFCFLMQFVEFVLSVKTHRRVATGNTRSREVAGALAGTATSSTARNSSTRRGL